MIAVLTARRPDGADYLPATLASVDASARDRNRRVFVDGSHDVPVPPWWSVVAAPRPASQVKPENRFTAWAAIEAAVEAGEDLILLEDDVRFCRNGAARAEIVPVPDDVAFLSLFAPFGDLTMPEGIWRSAITTYGYAQALKIPLRTCRLLASVRWEMVDCPYGFTDGALRYIGERRKWFYGVHYPGIVQHVGAISASGLGPLEGCRVSRAYVGDDYDAHSLSLHHYTWGRP